MRATQLLREEHEIILRGLHLLEVAARRRTEAPADLIAFFKGFADAHHHHKEEEILFPAMEAAGFPRDAGPVAVMLQEHEQGRALLRTMGDPATFAAAARAYTALLQAHIEKENQVLFRLADEAIAGEDQRRLDEAFEAFEQGAGGERNRHEATLTRLSQQLL